MDQDNGFVLGLKIMPFIVLVNVFAVRVCLKKAQCDVRLFLHCTGQAFPGQQEEGWWIQLIHRCMYVCLCVLSLEVEKKNPGRTAISMAVEA